MAFIRALAPVPALGPIERVSPSTAEELLSCQLRVAFNRDSRFAYLRGPSPASVLGQVSHDLARAVATGRFDEATETNLRMEIEGVWEAGIRAGFEALRKARISDHLAEPSRWPRYQRVRVSTIRAVERAVRRRKDRSSSRGGGSARVEISLASTDPPLVGRIDRVEITATGTEIIDIKSGWRAGVEVPDRYRRQLMIYAALWRSVKGSWPHRLSIEALSGDRETFGIDPEEVSKLVAEIVRARDAYNLLTTRRESPLLVAKPGEATCRFCPFRPACYPFLQAFSDSWGWWLVPILGEVRQVLGRGELIALDVLSDGPAKIAGMIVRVLNVPARLGLKVGDVGGIVDLSRTASPTQLEVGPETRLDVWRGEEPAPGNADAPLA